MGKLNEQTAYEYDLNGNKVLRRIKTDGKPVETIWRYDSLDQLKETIEAFKTPDQKITQYRYDSAGRLTALIKHDGISLKYKYDALGRKISLESSDKKIFYTYEYDKNDNLLFAKDEISGTSISSEYDRHNQLSNETLPFDHKLTYKYDVLGHIENVILPDETNIEYVYEGETLRSINRLGALSYSHKYTSYGPSTNPTYMTLPGQAGELQFDYDRLHRVTGIKSSQWHETQKYHAHLLKERTTQDDFGKTVSTYKSLGRMKFQNKESLIKMI